MTKFCKKCNIETERYAPGKRRLWGQCKRCVKTYNKTWNLANSEKKNTASKIWNAANPEKIRVSRQALRDKNPEKFRLYNKAWRAQNPAKVKAYRKLPQVTYPQVKYPRIKVAIDPRKKKIYNKTWQAKNPGQASINTKVWRVQNPHKNRALKVKRRALKRGAKGSCNATQLKARIDMYGGKCWIPDCNKPYEAIDHVIALSKGGSNWPSNLRPICAKHNSQKGAQSWRNFLYSMTKYLKGL